MNNQAIINQLEKALKEKDDKTLRIRVEVLLGMLKDLNGPQASPQPFLAPSQPKPIQQPISDQTNAQNGSQCVIPQPTGATSQNRTSKKQVGEDYVPGKI